MEIKISGGYYKREEPEGSHALLECGMGAHILLRFYDPMILTIGNEEIITKKDAFIIYTSGTKQNYRSVSGGFTNDYVSFFADVSFFKKYALPLNEVFYSSNPSEPAGNISYITWMLTDVMVDHTATMIEQLDLALRSLQDNLVIVTAKGKREHLKRRQYINLREQVRADPVNWTVEKMAKKIYLTKSHFCITYKEQFGITPKDDLLGFTLDYAKKLLCETELPISEISEKCGYVSPNNFTRAFKNYTGITPLKYRNNLMK